MFCKGKHSGFRKSIINAKTTITTISSNLNMLPTVEKPLLQNANILVEINVLLMSVHTGADITSDNATCCSAFHRIRNVFQLNVYISTKATKIKILRIIAYFQKSLFYHK